MPGTPAHGWRCAGTRCCPQCWSARLAHHARTASQCARNTSTTAMQQVGGVSTAGRERWPGWSPGCGTGEYRLTTSSRDEGFGLPLAEAMATGLPVVLEPPRAARGRRRARHPGAARGRGRAGGGRDFLGARPMSSACSPGLQVMTDLTQTPTTLSNIGVAMFAVTDQDAASPSTPTSSASRCAPTRASVSTTRCAGWRWPRPGRGRG